MSNNKLNPQQIEYCRRITTAAMPRLLRKFNRIQASLLATLMVAQARLETANFTSNVFLKNNNAFGYKFFKGSIYQSQNGSLSPEGDNYAKYLSIEASAMEVADWLCRRQEIFAGVKTPDHYALALKGQGYFTGPLYDYAKLLKYYLVDPLPLLNTNQLNTKTESGIGWLLALLAGCLFIASKKNSKL